MFIKKCQLITFLVTINLLIATTLQEIYDEASPANNFDKYIELEPNNIYTGGIGIYEGDIYLNCNGSIIDLEEGQGIWLYADEDYPSSLKIEHCSITNGLYYGLSFGGTSYGEIYNCNFINTNFGLKLFDESNVYITNSIFMNHNSMGVGVYTEIPTLNASYLLFWDNVDDCLENCPG